MATYAIGDIQGCYQSLLRLLEVVAFDPGRDRLWLAGDLVNRGPDSLQVLRWARRLEDRVVTVLGNHDLHLLAVAYADAPAKHREHLAPILAAPDGQELLGWLRRQKMMHFEHGVAMVHAGLLPKWSIEQALSLAGEVEAALRGPDFRALLFNMYGNQPARWSPDVQGFDRHRVIINVLTRMRMLRDGEELDFAYNGAPEGAPAGLVPWYDVPRRAAAGTPIIFGHWAALGPMIREDVLGIDSGCVWGRSLTAFRLDDRRLFEVPCQETSRR